MNGEPHILRSKKLRKWNIPLQTITDRGIGKRGSHCHDNMEPTYKVSVTGGQSNGCLDHGRAYGLHWNEDELTNTKECESRQFHRKDDQASDPCRYRLRKWIAY